MNASRRARAIRWRVSCINWTDLGAPKALAYAVADGEVVEACFFESWAEAIAHVQGQSSSEEAA